MSSCISSVLYKTFSLNNFLNIFFVAYLELTELVSDRVKEVTFNEDFPEEFALIADHNIIFLTWVRIKRFNEAVCYSARPSSLLSSFSKTIPPLSRTKFMACCCRVPSRSYSVSRIPRGGLKGADSFTVCVWSV